MGVNPPPSTKPARRPPRSRADGAGSARPRRRLAAWAAAFALFAAACTSSQLNPDAVEFTGTSPVIVTGPVKVTVPAEGSFNFVGSTEVTVRGTTRPNTEVRLVEEGGAEHLTESEQSGAFLIANVPLSREEAAYEIDTGDRVGDLSDGTVDRRLPVTGFVLPGATVTLAVANTSTTRTVLADAVGAFSFADVAFNEGPNSFTLTVVAENAQPARIGYSFVLDTTSPVVEFTSITSGDVFAESTVNIQGRLDEANVLIEYTDPETGAAVSFLNTARLFDIPFFSFPEGYHSLDMRFIDSVGNTTERILNLAVDLTDPPLVVVSPQVSRDFFTGTLEGTTRNLFEEVVAFTSPGALVEAELLATGDAYSQTSDVDGSFTIPPFADLFGQTLRYLEGEQAVRISITDPSGRTRDELLNLTVPDGPRDDRQVTVIELVNPAVPPPAATYTVTVDGTDYSVAPTLVQETAAVGDGGTNYAGNLSRTPVIPGTVQITDPSSNQIVTDDGAGNLGGAGGSGTVVYATGGFNVTFNVPVLNGASIAVRYNQDAAITNLQVVAALVDAINADDGGATAAHYAGRLVLTGTAADESFATALSPDLQEASTASAALGTPPPLWVASPQTGASFSASGFNAALLAAGTLSPPLPVTVHTGTADPYESINFALDGRNVTPPEGANRFVRCDPALTACPRPATRLCLPGDPASAYPELILGEDRDDDLDTLEENVIKVLDDPSCDGAPLPAGCLQHPDGRRSRVLHLERTDVAADPPNGGCPAGTATAADLDPADVPPAWLQTQGAICFDPFLGCPLAADAVTTLRISPDGIIELVFGGAVNLESAQDGFPVRPGDSLTIRLGAVLGRQTVAVEQVLSPTRLRTAPLVTQTLQFSALAANFAFRIDRNPAFLVSDTLTDGTGELGEAIYGSGTPPVFDSIQGQVSANPLTISEVQSISFAVSDGAEANARTSTFRILTPGRARIELLGPTDGIATSDLEVAVEGFVRGDPEVPFVEINGRVAGVDPSGHFILHRLPLLPNQINQIQVIAVDSGGNVITVERSVRQIGTATVAVDVTLEPSVTPDVVAGNDFFVSGTVSDSVDSAGVVIAGGRDQGEFLIVNGCTGGAASLTVNQFISGFGAGSVDLTPTNSSILYVLDGPAAGTSLRLTAQVGPDTWDLSGPLCAPLAGMLLLQRDLLVADTQNPPRWSVIGSIPAAADRQVSHQFNFGFSKNRFLEITIAGFGLGAPGAVDSDTVGTEIRVEPPFVRPVAPVRFSGADGTLTTPCPGGSDPACEAILTSPSNVFAIDRTDDLLTTQTVFPEFDDTAVRTGDLVAVGAGSRAVSGNELRYYEVVADADPTGVVTAPNQLQLRSVDRALVPNGALITDAPASRVAFAVYPDDAPLICGGAPCPGGPAPGVGPAESNQPILTRDERVNISGFVGTPDAIVVVDGVLSKTFPGGDFFIPNVPLVSGVNVIELEAQDFAGLRTTQRLIVQRDSTPPQYSQLCLAVDTSPVAAAGDPCGAATAVFPPYTVTSLPFPDNTAFVTVKSEVLELRGVLRDQNFGSGVRQIDFAVNGTTVTAYDGFTGLNDPFTGSGVFTHQLNLVRGANEFVLEAVDRAGNRAAFTLIANLDVPDPRPPTVAVDCLTDGFNSAGFGALTVPGAPVVGPAEPFCIHESSADPIFSDANNPATPVDLRSFEQLAGRGDGVNTNFTGRLAAVPVQSGSIRFTDGVQIVLDDGAGNLIGDVGVGTNTVSYSTGDFDFDFAAAPGGGADVTVRSIAFEALFIPVEQRLAANSVVTLTGRYLSRDGTPPNLTVDEASVLLEGEVVPTGEVVNTGTTGLAGQSVITVSNAVGELCRCPTAACPPDRFEPVLHPGDTLVLSPSVNAQAPNAFLYRITDVSNLCAAQEISLDKELVVDAVNSPPGSPGMIIHYEQVFRISGVQAREEGLNTLRLQAVDDQGNATLSSFSFIRDTQPPAIVIQGIVDGFVTTVANPFVFFTDTSLCTSELVCPQAGFSPVDFPTVGDPAAAGGEALQIRIARLDENGESPVGIPAAVPPVLAGDPLKFGWVYFSDDLSTPGAIDPIAVPYDLAGLDGDADAFTLPLGYPDPNTAQDPNTGAASIPVPLPFASSVSAVSLGLTQASFEQNVISTPLPGDVSCFNTPGPAPDLTPPVPCETRKPLSYRVTAHAADQVGHHSVAEVSFDVVATPETRLLAGAMSLISENPFIVSLLADNTGLNVLLLDRLDMSDALYTQNLSLAQILGDFNNPGPLAVELIDSGTREAFAVMLGILFSDPDQFGPAPSSIAVILDVLRVLIDNGAADDLLPILNNDLILDACTQTSVLCPVATPVGGGDGTALFTFLADELIDRSDATKNDVNNDGRFFRTTPGPFRHLLPLQQDLLSYEGAVRRRNLRLQPTGQLDTGFGLPEEAQIVGLPAGVLGFQPLDSTDLNGAATPCGVDATDDPEDAVCASPINVQAGDRVRLASGPCNGFEAEIAQVIDDTTLAVDPLTPFPGGCGVTDFEIYYPNGPAASQMMELIDGLLQYPLDGTLTNTLGDNEVLRSLAHLIEELFNADPAAQGAFDADDVEAGHSAFVYMIDDLNAATGTEFGSHLLSELNFLFDDVSTPNSPLRPVSPRLETLLPIADSLVSGNPDPATGLPRVGYRPGLLDLPNWPTVPVDLTAGNAYAVMRHIDMLQAGLETSARENSNLNRPIAELIPLLREIVDDPDDSARGQISGGFSPPNSNPTYRSVLATLSTPLVKLLQKPLLIDLMDTVSDILNPCDFDLHPGPGDCDTAPELGRTYNGDLTDYDEDFVAVAHPPPGPVPLAPTPDPLEENPPLLRAIALIGAQRLDSDLDGAPDSSALRGVAEALRALTTPIGLPGQGEGMNPGYPGPLPEDAFVDTPICRESFFDGRTPLEIIVPVIDGYLEPLPVGVPGVGETPADLFARSEDILGRDKLTIILQGLFDDPHVDEAQIPDDVDDCAAPCRDGFGNIIADLPPGDGVFLETKTLELLPEVLNTLSRFGFNSSDELTSIFDTPSCTPGNCTVENRLLPAQQLLMDIGLPLDAPFQIGSGGGVIAFNQSLTQEAFLQLANFTQGEDAANYVLLLASRIAEDIQPINATTPLPPDVNLAPAALRALADPDGDGDPIPDGIIDDFLPVARMLAQTAVVRQTLDLLRAVRACGVDAAGGNAEIRGGAVLRALTDGTLLALPALSGAGNPGDPGDELCPSAGGGGNRGGPLDETPLFALGQTPSQRGVMQGGSRGEQGAGGPGTFRDPSRDFRDIGVGPDAELCVVTQLSPINEVCAPLTAQPAAGLGQSLSYNNAASVGVFPFPSTDLDSYIAANCPIGSEACSYRVRAMREPYNGCLHGDPIELGTQIGSDISTRGQSYLDFVLRALRFAVRDHEGAVLAHGPAGGFPLAPAPKGRLPRLLDLLVSPAPFGGSGGDIPLLLDLAPAIETSLRTLLDPVRFPTGVESPFERALRVNSESIAEIDSPEAGTLPFDLYPTSTVLYQAGGPGFATNCLDAALAPKACAGNGVNDAFDLSLLGLNSLIDQLEVADGQNGVPRNTTTPALGDDTLPGGDADPHWGYSDDPQVLFEFLADRLPTWATNFGPGIQILLEMFDTVSRYNEFDPDYPALVFDPSNPAADCGDPALGFRPCANTAELAAALERFAYSGNCRPHQGGPDDNNCRPTVPPYLPVGGEAPRPGGAFGLVYEGVVDDGPAQTLLGSTNRLLDEWLTPPNDPADFPEGVMHRERLVAQLMLFDGFEDALQFLRETFFDDDPGQNGTGRVIDPMVPILVRFGNRAFAGNGAPASTDSESAYDVLLSFLYTLVIDQTDCDPDAAGGAAGIQRIEDGLAPVGTFYACQTTNAPGQLPPPALGTPVDAGSETNARDAVFRDLGINVERSIQPLFDATLFDRLLALFDADPGQPDLIERQLPFSGNMILGLTQDPESCDTMPFAPCAPRLLQAPPGSTLLVYNPGTILADALIADIQFLIPDDGAACPPPASPPFLPPGTPSFSARPYGALCDPLVSDDLNRDGVVGGLAGGNLCGTGVGTPGCIDRIGNGIHSTAPFFDEEDNDPDGDRLDLAMVFFDDALAQQGDIGFTLTDGAVTIFGVDGVDEAFLDGLADVIAAIDPAYVVDHENEGPAPIRNRFTVRAPGAGVSQSAIDLLDALGELLLDTQLGD